MMIAVAFQPLTSPTNQCIVHLGILEEKKLEHHWCTVVYNNISSQANNNLSTHHTHAQEQSCHNNVDSNHLWESEWLEYNLARN